MITLFKHLRLAITTRAAVKLHVLAQRWTESFIHLPDTWRRSKTVVVGEMVYYAFPSSSGSNAIIPRSLRRELLDNQNCFGVVRYFDGDQATVRLTNGEIVTASGSWFWPLATLRDINDMGINITGV